MAKDGRMALVSKDGSLSIAQQCVLLGLSRSSFYYEPCSESALNLELMQRIDKLHLEFPFYGVRRMTQELKSDDLPLNEKRIRRLMQLMDLKVIYPKPDLSKPSPWHLKYPYLLRGMGIDKPNQVWSMDITYIPMQRGFMYLFGIIDWHSRYLLGWQLSNSLSADFCIETLKLCLRAYGRPGIINTDQGTQFTCEEFTSTVLDNGIRLSMDGRGRATDNIAIERFWRTVKYEHIYLYGYESTRALAKGLDGYITFYNEGRKHQGLAYRTPKQVYNDRGRNDRKLGTVTAFPT